MPIPPGDNPNRPAGGAAWDAAREAMAAVAQAGGQAVDLFGIAQKWGVAAEQMISAMSQVTMAEGRAAREVEQLQSRAAYARTPEGRERMQEAAGYRGQLTEARRAATEPMGPPRALFRERERVEARQARAAEREDREAASARRYAAGIAEREEARAARAAEREDREAASARRFAAGIAEREEARAAKAAGPMGPPRELFRAQKRKEAETERVRADAEREQREAVFGRTRYGPVLAAGALAHSGILTGRYAALAGGAAGVLGGVAAGGIPGIALGVASVARAAAAAHEDIVSAASTANPVMGATVAASEQRAEVARGATPEAQLAARQKAIYEQAKARYYDARGFGASLSAYHEMQTAGAKYAATGELPAWYKEEVRLPVEGAMVSDPRQFWERASLAGAQGGELSADSLREQLKLMRGQHQLLEEIKDTNLDAVVSKWRR